MAASLVTQRRESGTGWPITAPRERDRLVLKAAGALRNPRRRVRMVEELRSTVADERLVARAKDGDRAAFDELARRHSTRLRRTLFCITRDCDSAYDAVQEALTRAWLNIGRFEGRSQFSTWLTRIGINEAYRGLRPVKPESLDLDDMVGKRVPGWGDRPDETFESHEFLTAIERALGELPIDYRSARCSGGTRWRWLTPLPRRQHRDRLRPTLNPPKYLGSLRRASAHGAGGARSLCLCEVLVGRAVAGAG